VVGHVEDPQRAGPLHAAPEGRGFQGSEGGSGVSWERVVFSHKGYYQYIVCNYIFGPLMKKEIIWKSPFFTFTTFDDLLFITYLFIN